MTKKESKTEIFKRLAKPRTTVQGISRPEITKRTAEYLDEDETWLGSLDPYPTRKTVIKKTRVI